MNKRKTALALILLLFLPGLMITIHAVPILGFRQERILQGLVVETAESRYDVGDEVFITIRLVNNLTVSIQVLDWDVEIGIIGANGRVLGILVIGEPRAPQTVQPGSNMFVFGFPWDQRTGNERRQVTPGEYTIVASIPDLGRWGSATILIWPL